MNNRKQELINELKEIEDQERKQENEARFNKLVDFLDNVDFFLKFVDHGRTSCSDEDPCNGHTTLGRGGSFRCNRCALLGTKVDWEKNRSWLITSCDASTIEETLSFLYNGMDLYIGTFAE